MYCDDDLICYKKDFYYFVSSDEFKKDVELAQATFPKHSPIGIKVRDFLFELGYQLRSHLPDRIRNSSRACSFELTVNSYFSNQVKQALVNVKKVPRKDHFLKACRDRDAAA